MESHFSCLKRFDEGVIIVAPGRSIEHDPDDAKLLYGGVVGDTLMNQVKLQVIRSPTYGMLRWRMQVKLKEHELVHVPISVNEDELALINISLNGIIVGAVVHDLPLNRLLPHPDLHVVLINQVALVLLPGHWDIDGRLSRAVGLFFD